MTAPTHQTLGRILTGRREGVKLESFSPAEWDAVITVGNAEGVSPSLYRALVHSGSVEPLPTRVRNALSAAYAVTLLHNERAFNELGELALRFKAAGIPAVVLKGACASLTVYPDIGLRPMGDIDLLIPADRLQAAVAIARSREFVETLPEASPGLDQLLSHHVRLQTGDAVPLTLELHENVVADRAFSYAVPVDWFWGQTEPLDGEQPPSLQSLLMLSPMAQVLYSAAHAMLQHGAREAPLRWFVDLDLLIRHYSGRIDWDALVAQAKKFEWGSALEAALVHTAACFETPIPARVTSALAASTDRHRTRVVRLQQLPATRTLEEYQKLLELNWSGRIRVALALVAPAPSYMMWRYQLKSRWSLPGNYLARWAGILRDGVRTLTALLRPRPG